MIITNNSRIRKEESVVFVEGSLLDVLLKVRDYVHQGHELITSPIAASGRMHFSPIRTVIISSESKEVDADHVSIIEAAIDSIRKSLNLHEVDMKNFLDYEVIDYELFRSSLKEIGDLKITV